MKIPIPRCGSLHNYTPGDLKFITSQKLIFYHLYQIIECFASGSNQKTTNLNNMTLAKSIYSVKINQLFKSNQSYSSAAGRYKMQGCFPH